MAEIHTDLKTGDIVPELNPGTAVVYTDGTGLAIHNCGFRVKCGNTLILPIRNADGTLEHHRFLVTSHHPLELERRDV